MSSTTRFEIDVAVAGGGPAGLAIAGAAAARGLTVALLDPSAGRWTATYGAFLDDLWALGLGGCVARAWERPEVHTRSGARSLDRTYALVDGAALADRLGAAADAAGVRRVAARVTAVAEHADGVRIGVDGEGELTARVLVDATGSGALIGRPPGRAAQVAFGQVLAIRQGDWPSGRAVWMDFRGASGGASSFLYALPIAEGRLLVEETSLAADPPASMTWLAARLEARIADLGLDGREVVAEERVHIPLDAPIPEPRGAMVAFGASSGFVHPATGYSLVRSLRAAAPVADALAAALPDGGVVAARRAHAAAWPTRTRATRALHLAGLRVLLAMDAPRTERFFDAFFALSADDQRLWLDPDAGPVQVAASMVRLFGRAPGSVRADVLSAAIGRTAIGLVS